MGYIAESEEQTVWDPLSRELRFQEVIFNGFKFEEDENPYANDLLFLERLYDHYCMEQNKGACKKLKQKIVEVKQYHNAYNTPIW